MSLVIALLPAAGGYAAQDLLGKPVWQRTLDATRGLGASRTLWLRENGRSAPDGIDAVHPRKLSASSDTVLLLSAELPCLTPASLKSLLKSGHSFPRALSEGTGRARALALRGSDFQAALSGTLAPRLLAPRDKDELLFVDTADSWARAVAVLKGRKIEELLRAGVRVLDPGSVFVEPGVRVGKGTTLHPWVHLEGTTVVGRDSSIGSFTHIVDSTLGAGTAVLDHCFIRSSRVGRNVSIGPFAHLRPESDVGDGAKVGNFVELKKTHLGAGAKAPHLSYLGDATIGKKANIGAGTITCNYDGLKKHQTVIGDGAFIGSDVQLVAPVRVGKGAYVAAGSCIVEDVPPHALALARSRQVVKLGWVKQRARPPSRSFGEPRRSPKGGGGRARPPRAKSEGSERHEEGREQSRKRG